MKIYSILTHTFIFACLMIVCAADAHDNANSLEKEVMIRELGSSSSSATHKPKPKPPPKAPSSTSSSSSSGSNSGSSGSTSGSTSGAPDASPIVSPGKRKSSAVKISFGVAALGALAAAASFQRRQNVVTRNVHPLEGSIAKRVENFEKFVSPRAESVRPTMDYNAMPDSIEMV
mmetsp:Transcript_17168/g.32507  ORF Transcript_17168/g.32507 Transcript_17168/m.32507 type:complete len:174 (+) Transcript_17168:132-653(+)|eukprot:CAMPEP_0176489642 /NCGR_PEP_ID=MMETSP0200_2-20121128/7408_1 /TAXON_ID=947934 /ORGANISM="Chaetoceros sp., Strain GSL56" /LENGTH=173 /DNA_ID=CAMNT_0017886819 /DNA_START=107 /DNA_END=628 /DNA_ORIENTATION=-